MVLSPTETVCSPDTTAEVCYRVAASREQRSGAFRLVYNSYLTAGLTQFSFLEMRVTPYQLLPSTEIFVAEHRGEVILTVSLVADGDLGLPMEAVYPNEVAALRARGFRFGEVSCLADRRSQFNGFFPVFLRLSRLMAQYARRQGLAGLLVAVHPRHARFYRRFMGFQQIGDEKAYPTVRNNPAVALCLDFARIDRDRPECYNSFFGEWLPDEELLPHPMDESERDYFRAMVDPTFITAPLADSFGSASPAFGGGMAGVA
jgi:hypothetical protein